MDGASYVQYCNKPSHTLAGFKHLKQQQIFTSCDYVGWFGFSWMVLLSGLL